MSELITPIVSIVMCAFNAANYIDETIDSVLAQTFTDFELIIVNDGSTDHTSKIVKSYADPRIVLVEQANGGPSGGQKYSVTTIPPGNMWQFSIVTILAPSLSGKDAENFQV